MAFDFPNSPTIGQTFQHYTWDGEKWVLSSGGIKAPPPPSPGDGYARGLSPLRALVGGSSIIAEHGVGKTTYI